MNDDLSLWVEVDLDRVRNNVSDLKSRLSSSTDLLAVVKANGYGHGDVEVAKAALQGGAGWLGVARVSEGASLRNAGIEAPILLLAEPPLGAIGEAIDLQLRIGIYTEQIARTVSEFAADRGVVAKVHLKVDTGMHRYGVQPEELKSFLTMLDTLPGIEVEGLWTHFAVAEDVLNPYTKQQLERYLDACDAIGPRVADLIRHVSNSAGTLTFPEAHFDMVRCGIAIYGIAPSPSLHDRADLQPALSLRSRVGQVKSLRAGEPLSYGQRYTLARDARVATIPVGYADGFSRALSNKGHVLIGGRRYTVAGTITMDHLLVDVGDADVKQGDEVVLIGAQGEEVISANDVAEALGTIPYEVVCMINARVPRTYKGRR